MRTLYHEFESLEHLLVQRLLPGGNQQPIRFVVFGGTGAVGGASVMELCRLIQMSTTMRERSLRGVIHATGMSDKEVVKFVSRLYLALGDDHTIEKIKPKRHYRIDGRIDLEFSLLQLEIPQDLPIQVARAREEQGEAFSLEATLDRYFGAQSCPFLGFVEGLGAEAELLHAVVVAIPLPSVATYTMTAIDRLSNEYRLSHDVNQRIKTSYLRTFIRGLAVIQQRFARHVVMAHTTAVGGMYRVDGGRAEIRLGFAHSALGKKLVDKKYFADELTQLYIDHGFDVLVTAAAIGIDAVEFRCQLPADRSIRGSIQTRLAEVEHSPVPPADLDNPSILLYPACNIPFDPAQEPPPEPRRRLPTGEPGGDGTVTEDSAAAEADKSAATEATEVPSDEVAVGDEATVENGAVTPAEEQAETDPLDVAPGPSPLVFGSGKELQVDAAIRSGENGLFSVANCVALYNVMKVSIPEELAMVLVRRAIFGPERRRDWFADKIAYYAETENALFALRLLDNYPELVRAHHGPFALQAYQALGSSTHQARLHELGLLMLLIRLRELGGKLATYSEERLTEALSNLDDFLWQETRQPCFEDLEDLDTATLASAFASLCEVDSMEDAGQLLGNDPRLSGLREPGRERFLARLATRIGRYIQAITSLGIPIVYRRPEGSDRILVGPYAAPLDTAVATSEDLAAVWQRAAEEHGAPVEVVRDWTVANNGFIDLRPHAVVSAAKEMGPDLTGKVDTFETREQLVVWLENLPPGAYFTTAGLVALRHRLDRLFDKVRRRKIELGTRETWKHLFLLDPDRRHILSPGLVETVRMYNEGLGKITGTEALWPRWGY